MSRCKAVLLSFIAIVILVLSQTIAVLGVGLLMNFGCTEMTGNFFASILYILLTFLLIKLVLEKFCSLKCGDFGLSAFRLKTKWVVLGLLLPLAVSAFYLLFVPGELSFSDFGSYELKVIVSGGLCFSSIAAGFVEEMVFRGVIFNSLKKAWNTKVAVIVPSVLFGAVHVLGMNFSLLSSVVVILAGTAVGVMFSLITVESGAVWSNGFVHALWNAIIIAGFLSISRDPEMEFLAAYSIHSDSFLITGGEFGIESSVIALAGYIIVSVIAFMMIRNKNSHSQP